MTQYSCWDGGQGGLKGFVTNLGVPKRGDRGRHRGHPLPAGTRWEALWEFAKKRKKSHTHTHVRKKVRKKPNERLEEIGDGFSGGIWQEVLGFLF